MAQRPPQQPPQRRPAPTRPQNRRTLAQAQRTTAPRYCQPTVIDSLLELLSGCQELVQNIQWVRKDNTYSARWFDGAIALLELVGLLQKPSTEPPENTLVIHPKRGVVRPKNGVNIWRENFKLVEGRGTLTGAAKAPSYKFEKSVYD